MKKLQMLGTVAIIVTGVAIITATTAFAETNLNKQGSTIKHQITDQQKAMIKGEAQTVAAKVLGINTTDPRLNSESFMQIAKEQGISDQELLQRTITAIGDEMKVHGASDAQVQARTQKLNELQMLFTTPVNNSIDTILNQVGK